MIPVESLIAVVGEYEDSPALETLLFRMGAQARPVRDDTQLSFISFPEHGISFAYEDENMLLRKNEPLGSKFILTAVHLYSDGFEGYKQYGQSLPSGLDFSVGSAEVRKKMGPPNDSGGGKKALGRIWPSWDRYDFNRYSLSVQYSAGLTHVDLISLIAPIKVRALASKP